MALPQVVQAVDEYFDYVQYFSVIMSDLPSGGLFHYCKILIKSPNPTWHLPVRL